MSSIYEERRRELAKIAKDTLHSELKDRASSKLMEVIQGSIIDLNDFPFMPNTILYNMSRFGVKFESHHIDGKKTTSSEELLDILLDDIERDPDIVFKYDEDNSIPESRAVNYSFNDPRSVRYSCLVYDTDCRWVDIGDYLMTLHNNIDDSPLHIEFTDLLFSRNGKLLKLYNYSTKSRDVENYLDRLCKMISSPSNRVTWSWRQ